MIKTPQDLAQYIAADRAANMMERVSILGYWLRLFLGSEKAHIWRYIKCLRHLEYHLNNSGPRHKLLSLYYHAKLHRLGFRYNLRIPPNVCEKGLMTYHLAGGGCFVNARVVGENCRLQAGVVIGASQGTHRGNPIIGNNVQFGPGAKVLGAVVVGDNVFIAANAVVVHDVPSNCLVGGVPAKLIKQLPVN